MKNFCKEGRNCVKCRAHKEFVGYVIMNEDNKSNNIAETVTNGRTTGVKDALKVTGLRILYFFLFFAYEELLVHWWIYPAFGNTWPLLLCVILSVAVIFAFLTLLFPARIGGILFYVITWAGSIYQAVNVVFYQIFQHFFSLGYIDVTNAKAASYYRETLYGMGKCWWMLVLVLVVPMVLIYVFRHLKVYDFRGLRLRDLYCPVLFLAVVILGESGLITAYGKDALSPYGLVTEQLVMVYAVEDYGIFGTTGLQLRNMLIPRKVVYEEFSPWGEEMQTAASGETTDGSGSESGNANVGGDEAALAEIVSNLEETSANVLDIDFVSLAAEEDDETIRAIHNYFASVEPSYKNEYTGMFEGFNLIFLTAESFTTYAIDEELTPTLYKLATEGFVFTNFYNPDTAGSTSDGEFVCSTSLCPAYDGARNFRTVGGNAMPFALGNLFNSKYGIISRAYHNNTYNYYGRDVTYPGMGYYYQGLGNGLNVAETWPESDLEMMEQSVGEYIDDPIFHTYYMTVSGHMDYTFEGNYCAAKHQAEVQDLPYSESCKAYLAAQMEFDAAMEYLLEQLEEKGIADRTVICFTGDHWPYALTNEEIAEFLGHMPEEEFELYKSTLVLWSGAIEEPITVDKVCGSMDILPTLLNLFGFDYDSRLLMGRDILSDTEGFVMFMDYSFITDKVMYNARTGEVTNLTDEEVTEEYIAEKRRDLANRWKYSLLVMENDYYATICDALGIEIPEVAQNEVSGNVVLTQN